MKKIILGSAFFAAAMSSAQVDFGSTRFGLTAGGTYSGVSNAHNPSGRRFSGYGGVAAMIPVDSDNQFFIQPEVEYFGAGERGDKQQESQKGWPHAVYADNYIAAPLLFKGYFSEAESEFFGLIGPQFNFLLNQSIKNPARSYYTTDSYGKARTFNFGVTAGVGYSYKRKTELTLRYNLGLSDTYPDLKYSPDNKVDPNLARKKSTQVLSLGLSYFFN